MKAEQLYLELEEGAQLLKALVGGFTLEEARSKPDPQSWSALEVVCHLHDEEREDFRQRLDITLLRPNQAWPPIDPEGWVHHRKYNERDLGEMVGKFLREREKSVA